MILMIMRSLAHFTRASEVCWKEGSGRDIYLVSSYHAAKHQMVQNADADGVRSTSSVGSGVAWQGILCRHFRLSDQAIEAWEGPIERASHRSAYGD